MATVRASEMSGLASAHRQPSGDAFSEETKSKCLPAIRRDRREIVGRLREVIGYHQGQSGDSNGIQRAIKGQSRGRTHQGRS